MNIAEKIERNRQWRNKTNPWIKRTCTQCNNSFDVREKAEMVICLSCRAKNKAEARRQKECDTQDAKYIQGRICYRASCVKCGKDRGYVVKSKIEKMCRSCAGFLNKNGKPSSLKGKKTGKPAWNRGPHYGNKEKQLIRNRMSRRMRHALTNRHLSKMGQYIFDILGYSLDDLFKHIDTKLCNGMTWGNMGQWHIDHVIPESLFNYNNMKDTEFKKCWALNNLQPLWASDNCRKSNKIDFYLVSRL